MSKTLNLLLKIEQLLELHHPYQSHNTPLAKIKKRFPPILIKKNKKVLPPLFQRIKNYALCSETQPGYPLNFAPLLREQL